MPTCEYCGEEFDGSAAHLRHLGAAHESELGPIDRRRVAAATGGDGGSNTARTLVGVLVFAAIGVLVGVYVLGGGLGGGDGGPSVDAAVEPTDLWGVHYHGTIEVTVDNETIDFARDEYQLRADPFHFEGGSGERWHGHARQVTLEYAMATLGIEVTDSTVAVDGRTYEASAPDETVVVRVNGQDVDPSTYELAEGDHIVIRAASSGG